MIQSKLIVSPATPGYSTDGQTLDVLIRVQAPLAPPADRPARDPIHLALVIDRSGSMSGRPLGEALKCAETIVRRMAPTDDVAVVAYDDEVMVPTPLQGARGRVADLLREGYAGDGAIGGVLRRSGVGAYRQSARLTDAMP